MRVYMRRALKCAAALLLLTGIVQMLRPAVYVHASAQARRRAQRAQRAVGWDSAPAILARIRPPKFPARDFPITNYGARAGGNFDNTAAISKAIEACGKAGGGRVVVPAGVFLT
ncbi:MAG: glycoside hydrolase family 28 protein, partial [Pyrinomonadaceae bacterium]